jgi:hypothetical protein
MEFETLFLSGIRADQPAAADADQKFYQVEDEGGLIERSDGAAWNQWGPSPGGATITRKASDTSRASTTTLADDPDLVFAIGANETHEVEYVLAYAAPSSATPDFKVAVDAPSGAAGMIFISGPTSGSTDVTATSMLQAAITAFATGIALGTHGGTTKSFAFIKALIRNGATPGDVALQWAQNSSNATATVLYTDSYMKRQQVS